VAKSITPQDVETLLAADDTSPASLLDVRRKPTFEVAPDRIPGSSWRDPTEVSSWSTELPRGAPVVVYCVHGHQVSQGVATQLTELEHEARYLEGGIEGWREAGMEVEPKVS
jgi:Fe-Mn family superoxide dismutase